MAKISGMKFISVFLALGFCLATVCAQSDSTVLLTYEEYLENILNYHPITKKADLRMTMAKAEMLGAKGNFDPVLGADWNQKDFDDKLYYQQYHAKLKIPTLYGIDVLGGYENTDGAFINPENNTDEFGLWHLGVEVNLLQGLFVNERRTAIEQAKVFQNLAENERQIILNDLVYNASVAYLIWQQYEYFEEILIENKSIADTYFQNTKQSFFGGEKTAMDTLEAFILSQDATTLIQKNGMQLIKSRQNVENFLWYNEAPVALQENTKPEDYKNEIWPKTQVFDNLNLPNHPIISASMNKLSSVEIEQRLKREKLKPKFKIKYNQLLQTSQTNVTPNFSINDYKWGFDFSMPLLFRSERGAIQKGEVKIQEIQLDIQNKSNELQNKIESSWEQQQLLQDQIALLSQNVSSYKLLLDGENEKFNFGESSVFLLNKRQEKYINGQLKLIESYIKQQIELLNFLYFSNQLVNR